MSDTFSASDPALGYFYQIRYSLLLLLQSDSDSEISIELVDDVAFHQDGAPRELLQTKHSIRSTASLTDASTDLWKTLRVWMAQVKDGQVRLDEAVFSLVSTGQANPGSAASMLRPGAQGRDVDGALTILTRVAENSRRDPKSAVGQAVQDFLNLSESRRRSLLSKVHVLDSSPNILESREQILKYLRVTTRPEFLTPVYERLEGWWFEVIVEHLADSSPNLIPYTALLAKINDIQEQFHQESLPIDFLQAIAPTEAELNVQERAFIEQLRLIVVSEPRIQKAINDYYRAFQQRSQWVREDLLHIGELETYEDRLIDEWERLHMIMQEELDEGADEGEVANAGRRLFNLIDSKLQLNIRPRVTEPYIMRGSFHILSNKFQVGWHRDFLNRLSHLLSTSQEGQA